MENIILPFYIAPQPHLNKDLFAYELLLRDSLVNINDEDVTPKIIAELEFNLRLESLNRGALAFINNRYVSIMTAVAHFQGIKRALKTYPYIKSPTEKIKTNSDLQRPLKLGATQAEALVVVGEC
jgi:hypothetical protein